MTGGAGEESARDRALPIRWASFEPDIDLASSVTCDEHLEGLIEMAFAAHRMA